MIHKMGRMSSHIFVLGILSAVFLAACRAAPTPPPPEKTIEAAPEISARIAPKPAVASYVVLISLDGVGSVYLAPLLKAGRLPTLAKLIDQGASTLDARTDVTDTTTTANHTCMLTGLPSDAPAPGDRRFHGYHFNRDPPPYTTLHNGGNPRMSYVPGMFDVAHDRGFRTCMFAGKTKFVLFSRSWDGEHGRPDRTGEDNGPNKMDRAVISKTAEESLSAFKETIAGGAPCRLTFVHLAELDAAGHQSGWGSPEWNAEAVHLDSVLRRLIETVEASSRMKSKTVFIVTADHGGVGTGHGNAKDPRNFAVPFIVMGPGVSKGVDLYDATSGARQRPGAVNPAYGAKVTPIRNGDAGNLALRLLGLPPIPGSLMFDMMS